MFCIRMGAHGIAHTRFAVSPLAEVSGLLELAARPGTMSPRQRAWLRRTREALGGLPLLDALAVPGYVPDLLAPEPGADTDVATQLRLVRDTPARRVRAELAAIRYGRARAGLAPRALPEVVTRALEAGEAGFTDRLATELETLWLRVLAGEWPTIRAELDADIDRQADVLARGGAAALLDQLHPSIRWDDGEIHIESRYEVRVECDDTLVLMPSAVRPRPNALIDPCDGKRRAPAIAYPVTTAPVPAISETPALLGTTRAALLADLRLPRTTTELAGRHHLTPSAVSYHLGILHRCGLASRSRSGSRVLYQRTAHADVLLSR